MKKKFLNNSLDIIKKNNPQITSDNIDVIRYGLEALYMSVTKVTIILLLAFILGVIKETIMIMIFFNIIRSVAFGMHASKSIHCYIMSTAFFIGGAYLGMYINVNIIVKLIVCLLVLIIIMKYAPADTIKRPIINKKRRMVYKVLSTSFASILIIISIIFKDYNISNYIIIGVTEAAIMIHPLTYKLFKLPYNNYKKYNYGLISN